MNAFVNFPVPRVHHSVPCVWVGPVVKSSLVCEGPATNGVFRAEGRGAVAPCGALSSICFEDCNASCLRPDIPPPVVYIVGASLQIATDLTAEN